jgi:thiol-disulfide isomerase/thioredoxin
MRSLALGFLLVQAFAPARANIITDVRAAIAKGDFARGESEIQAYRSTHGVTPEMLEALSWLGRGALAAKNLDKADAYAAETRRLALDALKQRDLDAEKHLPIALGASIEVHGRVLDAHGQRSEAVSFLRGELERFRNTSIRTRIQKNLHLLSLEGKAAPPLEVKEWVGRKPESPAALKGKSVLLFFWAHWCGDCKNQAPILAQLQQEYASKGLVVMGPTQRYGYVARGQEASPEEEIRYIDQVRKGYYAALEGMAVPVSEENFKNYGSSTTPTLVLIDRQGVVKLYHPGNLPYDTLASQVRSALAN